MISYVGIIQIRLQGSKVAPSSQPVIQAPLYLINGFIVLPGRGEYNSFKGFPYEKIILSLIDRWKMKVYSKCVLKK